MYIQRPLQKNWTITQRFETRVSYMRSGKHSGIDWACPTGTELLACFEGVITKIENKLINSGYGRAIYIRSKENPDIVALYGHTSKALCKVGSTVRTGQIIGLSGRSGFVFSVRPGGDPSHLHFALIENGQFIDPLPLFSDINPVPLIPSGEEKTGLKIEVKDANEEVNFEYYTVKKGDTLYAISQRTFGKPGKWKEIFELNRDVIKDPRTMRAGLKIKLPRQ
jgi:murein DD-endopeptidase MepM/ murein hydrolase activator NlpD